MAVITALNSQSADATSGELFPTSLRAQFARQAWLHEVVSGAALQVRARGLAGLRGWRVLRHLPPWSGIHPQGESGVRL
jgi:hypothetical protein